MHSILSKQPCFSACTPSGLPATRGFSLVELSIVLVILGLLTGGILAGQSLIRAAELRGVSTEAGRYIAAISTFKDKYFGVPGDLNNATSFGTTAWVGNGDGDGRVEFSATATSNEASLFWVHLGAAGLVEGSFTNMAATSTTASGTMTAGTHNPRSKVNGAAWNIVSPGTNGVTGIASTALYPANYGNALFVGGGSAFGTDVGMTAVLKSEEAWNVDTKMDDGRPDLGTVMTLESQGSATAGQGCGNLAAAATALAASSYDLTATDLECSFIIKTGF